jgi:hypothetical protein
VSLSAFHILSFSAASVGGSATWEKQGPISWGVQAGRQALRQRHIGGTEVRKKRPRGFK